MAKKILGVFIVIIFCGLLFVFGSALILFLAPGTEIFGIRYVGAGTSKVDEPLQNLTSFSGDIYIETYSVPITIKYSDYNTTSLYFQQEFVGFTRTDSEKASVECAVDASGNLRIKTTELVPWVYAEKMTSDYELVLTLRAGFDAHKDIYVTSNSSTLLVDGYITCSNFSFVSSEALTINGAISTTNFKYHTNRTITLDDKVTCTNVDLKSTSSNINITKGLAGDIVAETKGGDIRFVSCRNLTATTNSGSIRNYGEGRNTVSGAVSITTRSGDTELGNVGSSAATNKLEIKSTSGSVTITNMYDGEITTDRGKVTIGTARAIVISANIGRVTVESVSSSIVVNGRNGKVYLGTNGTISNPTVRTTTGTIDVSNAVGEVYLESTSNAVTLNNLSSTKIYVHAGRALTATGLQGEVKAYANGACNLTFARVSGNVNVSVGSKCKVLNIDATCNSYAYVDYYLRSTKGTKAKLYAGDELLEENTTIDSGTHAGQYKITATGAYAKIVLKFAV